MNLIVAVDNNWGIGKDNDLLVKLSGDMRYFKETTLGKTVIMGRKTLESLPNSRPLPNRDNIVLTKKEMLINGAIIVNSVEQLLNVVERYESDKVFVIGGAEIYKTLLPYCKKAYVTKIQASFEADKFFENLDLLSNWQLESTGEPQEENGIIYSFNIYTNNDCK